MLTHDRVGADEELLAGRRRVEREQVLVGLVGHRVDVRLEGVASRFGERRSETSPVLGFGDMPPGVGEEALQPDRCDVGDHPVEALSVEIDDHREVAETLRGRVGDRFPDVALVEFGVADEREESCRGERGVDMRVEVAAGERREQRCDRSEPDRAGGEVRDVGILGT